MLIYEKALSPKQYFEYPLSHKVNIQWREKQQLVKAVLQFEGKNLFLIPYFLMMFKNTFSITEGDLISLKEPTLQNT